MAKEIPLTKGAVAIVDDEDYDRLAAVGKWCYDGHGYAVINSYGFTGKRGHLQMHRVVNGTPPGLLTDHINGDRLDNRRSNLRTVNATLNGLNKIGHRNKTYSGYYKTSHGSYCVRYCNRYIGSFDCEELAYQVYTMLLSGELTPERVYTQQGFERKRGKYQVRVREGDNRYTFGVFDSPDEAHSVYRNIKEQMAL